MPDYYIIIVYVQEANKENLTCKCFALSNENGYPYFTEDKYDKNIKTFIHIDDALAFVRTYWNNDKNTFEGYYRNDIIGKPTICGCTLYTDTIYDFETGWVN